MEIFYIDSDLNVYDKTGVVIGRIGGIYQVKDESKDLVRQDSNEVALGKFVNVGNSVNVEKFVKLWDNVDKILNIRKITKEENGILKNYNVMLEDIVIDDNNFYLNFKEQMVMTLNGWVSDYDKNEEIAMKSPELLAAELVKEMLFKYSKNQLKNEAKVKEDLSDSKKSTEELSRIYNGASGLVVDDDGKIQKMVQNEEKIGLTSVDGIVSENIKYSQSNGEDRTISSQSQEMNSNYGEISISDEELIEDYSDASVFEILYYLDDEKNIYFLKRIKDDKGEEKIEWGLYEFKDRYGNFESERVFYDENNIYYVYEDGSKQLIGDEQYGSKYGGNYNQLMEEIEKNKEKVNGKANVRVLKPSINANAGFGSFNIILFILIGLILLVGIIGFVLFR